jgi:hypothetical protein
VLGGSSHGIGNALAWRPLACVRGLCLMIEGNAHYGPSSLTHVIHMT